MDALQQAISTLHEISVEVEKLKMHNARLREVIRRHSVGLKGLSLNAADKAAQLDAELAACTDETVIR